MLECRHKFCLGCIVGWTKLNTNCPLCKRELLFVTHLDAKGTYVTDIPVEARPNSDSDHEENLDDGSLI